MAPPTLIVNVADLLRRTGTRREVRREAELPDLALSSSRVPDGEPVTVDAVVESIPEGVMASGAAEAPWTGSCRRCLRETSGQVRAEFRELYERRPTEGDSYPLSGEQIDLEPMVRDVVLLELPLAPLCSEDCQGLCPQCGADRNENSCDCDLSHRDERWAALDELRFDQ
jgi:uncharacterized protein